MKTWIALLRGINVGGSHSLPMQDLTALLESIGCSDVKTYIQSGNVVFRSATNAAPLETRIAEAVSKSHGFEPRVLILSRNELQKAAAANPFSAAAASPKSVHLFFLSEAPQKPDLKAIDEIKVKSESFALQGKVFYLHTPDGFGTSRLAGRVERLLGVEGTARNWRTVSTLLELAATYE